MKRLKYSAKDIPCKINPSASMMVSKTMTINNLNSALLKSITPNRTGWDCSKESVPLSFSPA